MRGHLVTVAANYRECPACGKRALRIATRCPQCGEEFPPQAVRWQAARPERRLGRRVAVTAVMLVTAAGLVTLALRRGTAGGRAPVTAAARAEPPAALETAQAAASPVTVDSAPSREAVPRVARTWTKVHARRSVRADVVAVLLPGDTVLADSLRGGWWRVALEGRVLGYVYHGTLAGN
jgi:hypothetical protein